MPGASNARRMDDFRDLHYPDLVIVRFIEGRPELSMEVTGLHTMRNGKITRIEYFRDHAEALAAVGRDLEIHMFEGAPISGPYRGLQGLREWREDTFDVIDDWSVELDDVVTGDDPDLMVVSKVRRAGSTHRSRRRFPLGGRRPVP